MADGKNGFNQTFGQYFYSLLEYLLTRHELFFYPAHAYLFSFAIWKVEQRKQQSFTKEVSQKEKPDSFPE